MPNFHSLPATRDNKAGMVGNKHYFPLIAFWKRSSVPKNKAAEDSRTPRRWRDFACATSAARFWIAAVLDRVEFRFLVSGLFAPQIDPPPYVGGYTKEMFNQ